MGNAGNYVRIPLRFHRRCTSWRDPRDVAEASAELEAKGYRLLVKNKTEPWGQVVTRFLSPEGLLVGVVFTPWLRQKKQARRPPGEGLVVEGRRPE